MKLINEKEKRVLGALYKLGDSPISRIAKETLINRTALYHTVDGLLKKGLVTKINKEGGAYFQPLPLDQFEGWSTRQLDAINDQVQDLHDWFVGQKEELPTLYSEIRYFEGKEGVKNLYADSWRDNPEKLIYAITDYDQAYASMGDFFNAEYFPTRINKKIKVKNLLPKHSTTGQRDKKKAKAFLRDMRFVDVFEKLGIELNMYHDKISIVALDERKPSGVIIKNNVIANAFKKIFERLWETSNK